MQPKESREDLAARRRERRLSEIDRTASAEEQAAGLTTELRAIYGLRGIPMMGGALPPASRPKGVSPIKVGNANSDRNMGGGNA
jgi:hypothetical protein